MKLDSPETRLRLSQRRCPLSGLRLSHPIVQILLLIAAGFLLATVPLPLAAASVAGAAFALALLVRPVIGLWVLPFTVPFGSLRALPLAGYGVGATEVLVGLTLAAWLARGVVQRRLSFETPPLLIPLLLLLGTMLFSITGAYAVAPAAKELVKWAEILLVYVLTFNLVEGRRSAWLLVGALLMAGALSALHGVAGSLLRIGPPQFAILGGRLYRAFGTFGQPNPFGGYVNHSLPIAAGLLLAVLLEVAARRSEIRDDLLKRAFLISSFGLLVAGLILSWSRGAWLGAAVGFAVVAVAWAVAVLADDADSVATQALRQRVTVLAWIAVAVVVGFVLLGGLNVLPASISARVDSALTTFTTLNARGANITDANFATLERVAHWQAAWDMWRDHFWTGVGIGNYAAAYPQYGLPKWPYALGHAHNIYFNMGAEIGFIGLLAYLVFIGAATWHTWRVARRMAEPWARGLAIGVLGVLVALAVHNFFDNMYVHAMGVHLALALGVVSALGRREASTR